MKNYKMMLIERKQISALSSGKIDKYEYLTGEEILPSNQQEIIEQAKFTYSPLGKAFEKQRKTIEDQGKKQVDALANLKPRETKPIEENSGEYGDYFKDKLNEIKKYYKPIDEGDLKIYDNTNEVFINFLHYKDPFSPFYDITNDPKTLKNAKRKQKAFNKGIESLKDYNIPYSEQYKINKVKNLYNSRNRIIKMFDDYNLMQKGKRLKILTPIQMLERLPTALAQVKAGNNSESLLNEIRQIVYSLYRSKEITKKVYNKVIKSIKV